MKRILPLLGLALALAACAPRTTVVVFDASSVVCVNDPLPVVAVIEFDNTTARFGVNVTGVEAAATARLITLLKATGCYTIVERSVLQGLIEQQGLESLDPVELARAAGAGYVITGVVTRATIDEPRVGGFGLQLGATTAQVEVDARATDIITGEVVVSKTGRGDASSSNVRFTRVPGGAISIDDDSIGPLLAEAADFAVDQVVAALVAAF